MPGPNFRCADWADTCATLHLWTQVVGEDPPRACAIDQSLVAGAALCDQPRPDHIDHAVRLRGFRLEFDFIDHALVIQTSDGDTERLRWRPAASPISAEVMGRCGRSDLGRDQDDAGRDSGGQSFDQDHVHADHRGLCPRFWRVLVQLTASARNSARGSSARSARCISSGAATISRSPAFRSCCSEADENSPNLGAWVMQEANSQRSAVAAYRRAMADMAGGVLQLCAPEPRVSLRPPCSPSSDKRSCIDGSRPVHPAV